MIYNLLSLKNRHRLRIKTFTEEENPKVHTVTGIWGTANAHERETYDMFGIVFEGHPDLRRMYMPEEFEYYPLRKDFPLMGIPGSLPLAEEITCVLWKQKSKKSSHVPAFCRPSKIRIPAPPFWILLNLK